MQVTISDEIDKVTGQLEQLKAKQSRDNETVAAKVEGLSEQLEKDQSTVKRAISKLTEQQNKYRQEERKDTDDEDRALREVAHNFIQ